MNWSERPKRELRLLVLDDDPEFAEVVEGAMLEIGSGVDNVEIKFADTELEAFKIMSEWDPSIILLDAHVAQVNTFELLENYLADRVPVIVTSTNPSEEIQRSALRKGAVAYFPKTEASEFPNELAQTIENFAVDLGPRQ